MYRKIHTKQNGSKRMIMEILIFAVILGVNVGMIAESKGKEFAPWWLYGTLLFVVAIVHVLLVKPSEAHQERRALEDGGKKCPQCAEVVKKQAKICRYCSHDFYKVEDGGRKCPQCAEVVKKQAKICRYCGHDFHKELAIT